MSPDKLKHIGPFARVVIYETRQAKAYRTVCRGRYLREATG